MVYQHESSWSCDLIFFICLLTKVPEGYFVCIKRKTNVSSNPLYLNLFTTVPCKKKHGADKTPRIEPELHPRQIC